MSFICSLLSPRLRIISRAHSPSFQSLHLRHSSFSFSKLSVTSPPSQLILQPFPRFIYVTTHSPTLLSLLLRHRIFTYVTWRAAHDYKPRFLISPGAPCALVSLFTSVQHCLEMLFHYLVTLSYKPVQTTSLHIRRFLQRHAVRSQSQTPNRTTRKKIMHVAWNYVTSSILLYIILTYKESTWVRTNIYV